MPVHSVDDAEGALVPEEHATEGARDEHLLLPSLGDLESSYTSPDGQTDGAVMGAATPSAAPEPSALRMAVPWGVGLGVFALIATLLLFLANSEAAHAPEATGTGTTQVATTSTGPGDVSHTDLVPAAESAGRGVAVAIPTPAAGYHLFVDGPDGFMMQYPDGWNAMTTSPGAQFTIATDGPSPLSWAQIDLPDPWSLPGAGQSSQATPGSALTTGDANRALSRAWVTYVMSNLDTLYPNDQIIQMTTPPTSLSFAGTQWEVGTAFLSTRNIQIEVLATIYNGQPYVISLYGANGAFTTGQNQYFDAMLRSFAFVNPPRQASQP